MAMMVIAFSKPVPGQSSQSPDSVDKPVEQAFHNIQVLQGMPQSELLPTMHFMRSSLGVHCDYCHIAEEGMYWKDDKPAKVTARRMIRMVSDINKNFGGELKVTCNTCHRGSVVPIGVPSVNQAAFENPVRTPVEPPSAALPTIETILENYSTAVGTEQASSGVHSRLIQQNVLRARLVDPQQTPIPIEIYEKAPDKVLVVLRAGQQQVRAAFDGSACWMEVAGQPRTMTASEQARIRSLLTIYPLNNLKNQYREMKVVAAEEIDDKTLTYVVKGITQGNQVQKLYFDKKSGLLVRRIAYTRLRIGDDPEQADFADYRDVGGTKLPFRVKVSYLDNSHLNIIRTISTVENNVAVDDGQFTNPSGKK